MTGDRHDNDETFDSFVAAMKHEIAANEWKGGWSEDTPGHRVWEVLYHALKLGLAVMGDEDPILIREFAADVANEAMLTADVAGALKVESAGEPAVGVLERLGELRVPLEAFAKLLGINDEDLLSDSEAQARDAGGFD